MNGAQGLIIGISVISIICYYTGIILVGAPPEWRPKLHENAVPVISGLVTAIGGTLAAHVGAVVGLTRAHGTHPSSLVTQVSRLQLAAAWAYVLSLVLALIMWGCNQFAPDTAEVVRNLALTLPGIAAGVLAIAVNVPAPAP